MGLIPLPNGTGSNWDDPPSGLGRDLSSDDMFFFASEIPFSVSLTGFQLIVGPSRRATKISVETNILSAKSDFNQNQRISKLYA